MPTSTSSRSPEAGIAAAAAAGLLGAVVWAVFTGVTHLRIGYLGVGVGALVGYAAARFGGGDPKGPLPFVASGITVIAVLIGDTWGWAGAVSHELGTSGISVSSWSIFQGLLTGSVDVAGHPVPIRELYRDDFSFVLVFGLVVGALAAYRISRWQLEALASPAPTFPPPVPGQQFPGYGAAGYGQPGYGPPGYGTAGPAAGFPPPAASGFAGPPAPDVPVQVDYFGNPVQKHT